MATAAKVFFGLNVDRSAQKTPACAVNASNLLVEAHQRVNDDALEWRLAEADGVTITWRQRPGNTIFTAASVVGDEVR